MHPVRFFGVPTRLLWGICERIPYGGRGKTSWGNRQLGDGRHTTACVPFTTLTPERQEVQYMAIRHLAVRSDGLDIALHLGVARWVRRRWCGCHVAGLYRRMCRAWWRCESD